MSPGPTLSDAVSRFGRSAKAKLDNPGATGEPEDQLRAPLETLVADIGALIGLAAHEAVMVGESSLAELMTRPDYAVTRKGALIGFIEVKAPGKGAEPNKFPPKSHDKAQWERLQSLPNLIYTDGNAFSLWRDGKPAMPVVHLSGDIRAAGAALSAPTALIELFEIFYQWQPIEPRMPRQLAETSARLCRLLRHEVAEQLDRGAAGLSGLKEDWRKLLFPHATDEDFADGYAQAVTFGLLMAKARGISLAGGIEPAAKVLKKSNSLIGSALQLLTEEADEQHTLDTSLKTLSRVLDVVNWAKISKGDPVALLLRAVPAAVRRDAAEADRFVLHAAPGRDGDGAPGRRRSAHSIQIRIGQGPCRHRGDTGRSGRRDGHLSARRAQAHRGDDRGGRGRRRGAGRCRRLAGTADWLRTPVRPVCGGAAALARRSRRS